MPRSTLAPTFALLTAGMTLAAPPGKPGPARGAFAEQVRLHFAEWDADKNGELSEAEIDRAVLDPAVKGPSAAAVAAIRLADRKGDLPAPLTAAALTAGGGPDFDRFYTGAATRIIKADKTLFPAGGPKLKDVNQGTGLDCFCLAPLGGLVARDPQGVAKMIRKQPDGKYAVALGGKEVTVPPPTDAELGLTTASGGGGLWVNVFERAVGDRINEAKPEGKRYGTTIDAATRTGSAPAVLKIVTGHAVDQFVVRDLKDPGAGPPLGPPVKPDDARARLAAATADKRLMTCGTPADVTTPGVPRKHAFALLGYDRKADAVAIWNPHGNNFAPKGPPGPANGYPTKDGLFRVPLTEFVQVFRGVTIETADPVKP